MTNLRLTYENLKIILRVFENQTPEYRHQTEMCSDAMTKSGVRKKSMPDCMTYAPENGTSFLVSLYQILQQAS